MLIRRSASWTFRRRLADRLIPRLVPGRHHAVWGLAVPR